ncbi:LexA family transcriptional regulator [Antarcticibacterium flavum]|uniref:LexA family transcriptional regulator n=1 Tax=Antarcticibacterium flavum TaxID=2058175 RepID=A0A5B7X737_9FLAO|nr:MULTISPECIES: XRE family transcriptional regulator [Antarcticibacterium]MCM4159954.1 transcriptional regulator [Antarcticibacterium sp. W02-3]QCY70451.1 LexA family transcriptional regulator [Antarcticibacterium flavum]
MSRRVEIGARLKDLRKKNKFSQQFVAENLFISQAAYSLIENSQNGIVAEHIVGLSNLYEVTTDFILKGDKHLIRISPSQGFVPYIKVKAHAGFVKNSSKDLDYEDYEWYRIPGYNPTQGHLLFEAEGESMVPTVLPGDVLICQKHNNWDLILSGSVVVLVTNESVLVKRLIKQDAENLFAFENDNPEDNEVIKCNYKEIKEIYMVRGKISNVLIPHHQMTSKGKIQTLEESIEYLKKELYTINKKLNNIRK